MMILKLTAILAALAATVYFGHDYWSMRQREGIVAAVRTASPVSGETFDVRNDVAIRDPHGPVRVLSVIDGLTLTIDEGGGHLGARGVVFSETNAASPDLFRPYFGESIVFTPTRAGWWSYRSSED